MLLLIIYRRTIRFSDVNSPTRTYTSVPIPYIVSIVNEPFRYSQYARDVGTPKPYLIIVFLHNYIENNKLFTRSFYSCYLSQLIDHISDYQNRYMKVRKDHLMDCWMKNDNRIFYQVTLVACRHHNLLF